MNVSDSLYQSAQQWPDKPAIYDEWGMLTYAELAKQVKETSTKLKAAGIKANLGVGVIGQNSRYFIIQCYAVMDCGAAVMPISNQMKTDEITATCDTAQLHAVLSDQTAITPFQDSAHSIHFPHQVWSLCFNRDTDDKPFARHVQAPALVRYTSGTTGHAKGVILSHRSILARIAAANKALQLGPDDTICWVLSMAYHFVVSIMLYLRYGSAIIICENFLADTIMTQANKHHATMLYASPMHIRLLASDKTERTMPTVKRVISTSAAISAAQCKAFQQHFNLPVIQAYGIIEIGLPIMNTHQPDEYPDAAGYALPDYEVEILDHNGDTCPANKSGHLVIRGPGMFDAYLSPPDQRATVLKAGWFYTGDLATKSPDGLIRIAGRKKSMINVSGNKVFPEEVEMVLNQHPAVRHCRISGFIHHLLGESVQAEVVLQNDPIQINVEDMLIYCRQRLSAYKIPNKIIFVKTLPTTGSGKLIRH